MNLYFRLLWLFLWRIPRCKKIDFLDTSQLCFRALPLDCDINGHLTNSRYPAFMDLARTYMLAQMGLLKPMLFKLKWLPVINAAEFTYIRDIKPLKKFKLTSKVVGWDEKYFYIEQRFFSENKLHAIVHVRGLFICKGKKVPTEELIKFTGFNQPAPKLPKEIESWKYFLTMKKQQNQPEFN